MTVTLLKVGGELLESPEKMAAMARVVARCTRPLVVVHGGGREIDAALSSAGIAKRQVDGLRITDAATLDIVVAVLAGTINTRFVAAINAAGGRAVGLTGADTNVAPVRRALPHQSTAGDEIDLGLVGTPTAAPAPALLTSLLKGGFIPVVACIGASRDGTLFNVNADPLAGSLAARLGVRRLLIAGGTAGVFDAAGATIPDLTRTEVRALVRSGTASAGMVAKLTACLDAVKAGVHDVLIVNGHDTRGLMQLLAPRIPDLDSRPLTRVLP